MFVQDNKPEIRRWYTADHVKGRTQRKKDYLALHYKSPMWSQNDT